MIRTMAGATIAALAVAGLATTAAARRYQPPSTPLPIAATTGVPTSIHDGDTFRFGKLRVRVWGIDAPELETQFGPAARAQAPRPVHTTEPGTVLSPRFFASSSPS